MLISEYLEGVRADMKVLGELGGPDVASLVDRLGAAVEPSLRTRMLDAVNVLVQEFNLHEDLALTLQLDGDDIRLSRLVAGPSDGGPVRTGEMSARIALRLTDELKQLVERLALDSGVSVNSWIVRALERSAQGESVGTALRGGRQLRGRGRS
jgi:HicB family